MSIDDTVYFMMISEMLSEEFGICVLLIFSFHVSTLNFVNCTWI